MIYILMNELQGIDKFVGCLLSINEYCCGFYISIVLSYTIQKTHGNPLIQQTLELELEEIDTLCSIPTQEPPAFFL